MLWRLFQLAMMMIGMIGASASGIFSDGWQHAIGIFISGILLSFTATFAAVRIIDRIASRPGTKAMTALGRASRAPDGKDSSGLDQT